MTLAAGLALITELGWPGVAIWQYGADEWNGALLGRHAQPDLTTVCWHHQESPEAVLAELARTAGNRLGPGHGPEAAR